MALAYPLLPDVNPTLIIHVHGGGFVAMTSFSHAVYTRRWARDTGRAAQHRTDSGYRHAHGAQLGLCDIHP